MLLGRGSQPLHATTSWNNQVGVYDPHEKAHIAESQSDISEAWWELRANLNFFSKMAQNGSTCPIFQVFPVMIITGNWLLTNPLIFFFNSQLVVWSIKYENMLKKMLISVSQSPRWRPQMSCFVHNSKIFALLNQLSK